MNYYVYYKVSAERLDEVRALVQSLLAEVEKRTGIRGRWMRRRDDPTTYMEVYEGIEDERTFEALLEREGAKLGLPRKVERFVCA